MGLTAKAVSMGAFFGLTLATWGSSPYPIDAPLPGPTSQYTQKLIELLKNWPPKILDYASSSLDPNPVHMACIGTPEDFFFIGIEQWMWIDAPIQTVTAVMDDMNHYQKMFPDYDDIHIVSTDRNKIVTFWEQHIPLFPNVKYEVTYIRDESKPGMKIYRYQLLKSSKLINNDGIIVLESMSDGGKIRTRYTEYDFYNANWGLLKTIAPTRIWKESAEGIYLSDIAIKLKAEHFDDPSWTYQRISRESKNILEHFPVDNTLKHRKRFSST